MSALDGMVMWMDMLSGKRQSKLAGEEECEISKYRWCSYIVALRSTVTFPEQ